MELTVTTFLIMLPMVFLAGLVDGIAGGGGLISLPAYLAVGLPPHLALGTNKLSSAVGTVFSTLRYCRREGPQLNLAFAALGVAMALTGSVLGADLALLVSDQILKYIMLAVLPAAAAVVLFSRKIEHGEDESVTGWRLYVLGGVITFSTGLYDGFYGPGVGTFLLLLLMGVLRFAPLRASAYTKIINLSSNLSALVIFLLHGQVLLPLGLAAAVCSIAGHYTGAGLVLKKGMKAVKPVMLAVIALLFIKIVVSL